jgi:peptide/nickel transport system substrate-binding protein
LAATGLPNEATRTAPLDQSLALLNGNSFTVHPSAPQQESPNLMPFTISSKVTAARRKLLVRTSLTVPALLSATLVSVGGLSSSASASPASPTSGGTVTEAIVGVAPNYIFPIVTPAADSGTNLVQFNLLMYTPLYLVGSAIVPQYSLATPPVYSNDNRTATVRLKTFRWSDGAPVTSRDVSFYFNLVNANKADWAGYTPGEFPDNVSSITTPNASTVVFHLNASYDPTWYTDNELSSIYAFPQHAWDKTSAGGAVGDYDQTAAGARAVYKYLAGQAQNTSTYATNPLWKVVDGPWQLKSWAPNGPDVFVPNPVFSPQPHISQYIETVYTSDSAEFNALLAGNEINIGTIPPQDLSAVPRLSSSYALSSSAHYQIGFMNVNFNNPVTGALVRQLYIRQTLQHIEDEAGQVNAYLDRGKAGYTDYGPLPPQPPSPYIAAAQETDPYPFSIGAARSLLQQHGWDIPSSGAATCARPGTAANECGAGIKPGQKLEFNFLYDTGETFLVSQVGDYKSDAAQAGIVLNMSSAPFSTVISDLTECIGPAACPASSWQMGDWNAGGYNWGFGGPYATGEPFTEVTNFASKTFLTLLKDTETSPDPIAAMHAYDTYMTLNLPVIWAPTTYWLTVVSNNLHGVQLTASGYENTTDWYLSK